MSETAFASCWETVSAALQPLLREFNEGDMGLRWNLARTLRPIVEECSKEQSAHVEVLALFEIQFALRLALSRFHDSLSHKKQPPVDMNFADEVSRADAAIADATLALLSLPPTTRRRSALCLIKNLYVTSFPHCLFVTSCAGTA